MSQQEGGPLVPTQHPAIARFARNDSNVTQRVPPGWGLILAVDPQLSGLTLVVDLALGPEGSGQRFFLSTRPISISGIGGLVGRAVPALMAEPDISSELTIGSQDSQARDVTIEIDLSVLDVLAIVRSLGALIGVAELSWVWVTPGNVGLGSSDGYAANWDQRIVIMRGGLGQGISFGKGLIRPGGVGSGGPGPASRGTLTMNVVDIRSSMGGAFPPLVVSPERFDSTDYPADSAGNRIPVLINGYPNIPCVRLTDASVGRQTFAYAASHGWSISSVRVNDVVKGSGDVDYAWVNLEDIDALGAPYSAVRFSDAATAWADTDVVTMSTSTTAGTFQRLGLSEIIAQMLLRYTSLGAEGVAQHLLGELPGRLPAPLGRGEDLIQGLLNGETTFLEWLEGDFLKSFPMVHGLFDRGRYGVVAVNARAEPVGRWILGQSGILSLASDYNMDGEDTVYNEFVMHYGYDPRLDTFGSVAMRGRHNSAICAASDRAFGRRPWRDGEISSPYIRTQAQAEAVLDWLVEHFAIPSWSVSYVAERRVMVEYRVGDTVLITDENTQWSNASATIERIDSAPGACVVRLRVWDRGPFTGVGGNAQSVI